MTVSISSQYPIGASVLNEDEAKGGVCAQYVKGIMATASSAENKYFMGKEVGVVFSKIQPHLKGHEAPPMQKTHTICWINRVGLSSLLV